MPRELHKPGKHCPPCLPCSVRDQKYIATTRHRHCKGNRHHDHHNRTTATTTTTNTPGTRDTRVIYIQAAVWLIGYDNIGGGAPLLQCSNGSTWGCSCVLYQRHSNKESMGSRAARHHTLVHTAHHSSTSPQLPAPVKRGSLVGTNVVRNAG